MPAPNASRHGRAAPWSWTASHPRIGAGDRDRRRAGVGHRGAVGGAEPVGIRAGRRAAGRVDGHELPVGVLDEREEVAADAAHVWVDDRERHGGVQGGIDRVAAGREGGRGRLGGVRMGRGDGPPVAARREPSRSRGGVIRGA